MIRKWIKKIIDDEMREAIYKEANTIEIAALAKKKGTFSLLAKIHQETH